MIIGRERPGYRRAKNGRSWFSHFHSREAALTERYRLHEAGIPFLACKVDDVTARGKKDRAGRNAVRGARAYQQALDIYEAGVLDGRKQARVERESAKLAVEVRRQRQRQAATDALKRAEVIALRGQRPH